MPPCKSSRFKRKDIAHSLISIDSKNSSTHSSPQSSTSQPVFSLKRPTFVHLSSDQKKKCRFDFEKSFDVKMNFWYSSNETLFQCLKIKIVVHGHHVDLDLLLNLHCPIKEFFEYQGWANVFSSLPKVIYEPLVRLFYADLWSSKPGEMEILVFGEGIFLNCDILEEILKINCSGFSGAIKALGPLILK